jgi:hypothetical protein
MDQVIVVPPHHKQALAKHEKIADQLFEGKAGADVADPKGTPDPMDLAVGDIDVFALVEGQQIDLMPP